MLLLDEPTGGMSPQERTRTGELIRAAPTLSVDENLQLGLQALPKAQLRADPQLLRCLTV